MSATGRVNGAAGFIGRVLFERLLRDGFCGQVVDRTVAADLSLHDLPHDARILRVEGSIADPGAFEQARA